MNAREIDALAGALLATEYAGNAATVRVVMAERIAALAEKTPRFHRGNFFSLASVPDRLAPEPTDYRARTPYGRRVIELESQGMTTSDAQGIADGEGLDDFTTGEGT